MTELPLESKKKNKFSQQIWEIQFQQSFGLCIGTQLLIFNNDQCNAINDFYF